MLDARMQSCGVRSNGASSSSCARAGRPAARDKRQATRVMRLFEARVMLIPPQIAWADSFIA
jgi:hypothetical protein